MESIDPIEAREKRIAKFAESEERKAALRRHAREVIESKDFRGSPRSGRFLDYIVSQALDGHFEALKERVIGVELFGRSPSYETGEDSIVRVAASEVRKRLDRHYVGKGSTSEFRLSLPVGSYVPEIIEGPQAEMGLLDSPDAHNHVPTAFLDSMAEERGSTRAAKDLPVHPSSSAWLNAMRDKGGSRRQWLAFGILLVLICSLEWGVLRNVNSHNRVAKVAILPWSAFLSSQRPLLLITSDPNIAEIQGLTGIQTTVSDYANHIYVPEPNALTPEVEQICKSVMIGNKSASIDTQIAANVAQIAAISQKSVEVRAARSIELSDLHTSTNFIFLASQRSDPWITLFDDQLDFRIASGKGAAQDFIANVHPRPHESSTYVPTARGGATGQTFAIIALVNNLDQDGQVLILAGADAEGTEAAGKLAVDLPRLATALQNCGISPSGSIRNFELLIRVNTMARSPNSFDVAACHTLPGPSSQYHAP